MLFEPSGDLRRDYGAYCHALGATEREELYSAVTTNKQLKQAKEATFPVSVSIPQLSDLDSLNIFLAPEMDTAPKVEAEPSDVSAPLIPRKSESSPSRRKKSQTTECASKADTVATPPVVTYIVMRNLKFCLHVRDMKPLALAIPHCTSLVSVEFVGCGLSRESYLLLVEAVYRSRRIASMTVDFNSTARPGFYEDPTLPSSLGAASAGAASDLRPFLKASHGSQLGEPRLGSAKECGALQLEKDTTNSDEDSFRVSTQPPNTLHTFPPSAYRGLNNVPSPLEVQIREEKERKGKIDCKKQAQLLQQQEQLAQFDRENPIAVPSGWPSALLTGVKHLSLRGNGINDNDISVISSLLSRHTRSELISLNLWGNNITDDGAVALAEMLKKNCTLQVLDLGHNDIGDVGLIALVNCFRMQEIPIEELQSYRRRYLLRRQATSSEKSLGAAAPPQYPSYPELYNAWYQIRYPSPAEDRRETKKGLMSKSKKSDPTLVRPTAPFDRDCFRMVDSPRVRVPGNTVLRCVNLGNNKRVTFNGASEALRILSLHEPIDDNDMMALQNSAVEPPELYCVSIALCSFVLYHDEDPNLQTVQNELTKILTERLQRLKGPPSDEIALPEDTKRRSPRNRK
ncbi:putative Leucine Rich repeat [Trypanosoma vivax]|uniref:Leucine-rich repeat protein (LRRP) n=1 Tax=Trypanosoma vivax (strain Y486) TaxID=1055687 RepID=G0U9M0_TRYVY|nr:hypothetical protein TRVL_04882 [Trypanosoma vivax]KAH8604888.1 putative Leucine Rich repeat [Trypanosoma vivax]CCC54306.1 conserved hypothetical protein [Trypanosoma vivax Y486]